MRITEAQVHAAYSMSRDVYSGKVGLGAGAKRLHEEHGLNINSARDFIEDYKALRLGKVFQRAMSAPAMEYFLSGIESEHGEGALSIALSALRKHITYYEAVSGSNLNKMRGVTSKFSERIEQPLDFEQFQESFEASVSESAKLTPEIRNIRISSSESQPKQATAIVTVYLRNPNVVVEVLNRANGHCERCESLAPFRRKKDRTPYLEVHHKKRLADGGEDTVENAIALCPNCHRELHYGL